MKKIKTNRAQAAFTLIELIVAIAIMVTLASVFVANFNGASKPQALLLAENNLVSDLHEMQSFAIAAKNAAAGDPASSYQVAFNLANLATSGQYSLSADDNNLPPVTYNLSTITLPPRIYIKSIGILETNGINVSATADTIYFTVPYGRVQQTYAGSYSATNEPDDITTIILSTTDNTLSKTIVINGITGNITSQ